jgi:hypothetical protein
MTDWIDRPYEEVALLNPAFVATMIWKAAHGYHLEVGRGLPFVLTFLVPAIVLNHKRRESFPRDVRTSLAAWLEENGEVHLGFPGEVRAYVQITKEGILFGIAYQALAVDSLGSIRPVQLARGAASKISSNTDDFRQISKASEFVGRWFARGGTPETILAYLGVRA